MKQFELEQSILDCWHVTDDIDLLYKSIMDNNYGELSTDQICNILLGIKELYNLKFNKCWEDFEGTIGEYREKLRNSN